MRRTGAGRVAAALALGLAVSAAAAQEPGGDRPSRPAGQAGGWGSWFGGKAKAEAKAAAPAAKPAPSAAEQAARERDRQQKALWRRIKVCERLAEIADQANDQELRRQAEDLEARVWEIYHRQTSNQRGAGPADPDQALLDEQLRTTTARPVWGRASEEARRTASLREGDE